MCTEMEDLERMQHLIAKNGVDKTRYIGLFLKTFVSEIIAKQGGDLR